MRRALHFSSIRVLQPLRGLGRLALQGSGMPALACCHKHLRPAYMHTARLPANFWAVARRPATSSAVFQEATFQDALLPETAGYSEVAHGMDTPKPARPFRPSNTA